MKALSIRQPWATLIAHGIKDVENRDWYTNYRGRIFIHAGQTLDAGATDWIAERLTFGQMELWFKVADFPRGAIIGEADLVDCVTAHQSRWFTGEYGFVLANPFLYDVPVPYKGALGLFNVPDEYGLRYLIAGSAPDVPEYPDVGTLVRTPTGDTYRVTAVGPGGALTLLGTDPDDAEEDDAGPGILMPDWQRCLDQGWTIINEGRQGRLT